MKTNRTVSAIAMCCGLGLAVPGVAAAAGAGDWTGAYIGGQVGYGTAGDIFHYAPETDTYSQTFDMDGYTVGIHGGYNWAVGGVVLGIEAEAAYADMEGDALCVTPVFTCGARMNNLLTLRGRVGMPVNNMLVYGTLGYASSDTEAYIIGPAPSTAEYAGKNTSSGWAAGLGAELAFNNNLRGRAELLYVDFGDTTYTIPGGVTIGPKVIDTQLITLRIGASWRF